MTDEVWVLGATGRTGRAITDKLHRSGVPLVLVGRDEARLSGLAAELGGSRVVAGSLTSTLSEVAASRPGVVVSTVGSQPRQGRWRRRARRARTTSTWRTSCQPSRRSSGSTGGPPPARCWSPGPVSEKLEPIFHRDSYGYRPGRGALDALAVTRKRCWQQDWVVDLDIRAFFDSVPHDLLLQAVAHHTDERWVLLYIARWLTSPMQMPDGTLVAREKGTPQGVSDLTVAG